MILTWLMLAVALALSAVAAFYSIVGLAAIFSASVIPIVVMGTILEVAKLTVTVWLHEYWDRAKWTMKLYLVPAVVVLMIITSMGIFGFLSKAHLDQAVPTGEVAAQVSLIDEKIGNERETITNARTLLAQLDKAVTDISNAPDREVNGRVISSAERALQVRRQQAADRARLTRTIEDAQKRIIQLQEEKAPIAGQLREVEAKVGPIKYIAALIYGDNPDANLLERAVRYMIILLVAVFDPLAIMMLLAFTESYRWHRGPRQMFFADTVPDSPPRDPEPKESHHDTISIPSTAPPPHMVGQHDGVYSVSRTPMAFPVPDLVAPSIQTVTDPSVQHDETVSAPVDAPITMTETDDDIDADTDPLKEAKRIWKEQHPGQTLKEQRQLLAQGLIDRLPWEEIALELSGSSEFAFGTVFPTTANKGDRFVRTDYLPTRLFKYNGDQWIESDKTLTDSYAHDERYIDYLIDRISKGQYDPELLTHSERNEIESKLRSNL